jgi:hypothetical protein
MRTVIDLTDLDWHFRTADNLLTRADHSGCLRQAAACLEHVDAVLAELVANDDVAVELATQLGRVRDGLSGHLEAAAALQDLALPDHRVAGILQRGVSEARMGIEAINEDPSVS